MFIIVKFAIVIIIQLLFDDRLYLYYSPLVCLKIGGPLCHETFCNKLEDQRFADLFQINKCIKYKYNSQTPRLMGIILMPRKKAMILQYWMLPLFAKRSQKMKIFSLFENVHI